MEPDNSQTKQTGQGVATLPNVPGAWPGGFGLYKYSKQAMQVNLWTLVFVGLLSIGVSILANVLLKQRVGDLLSFVIGALETAVITIIFLKSVAGQKVSVENSIKEAFPFWLRMFLLRLLVTAVLIISVLAFVIPFFFVFPRLLLADYFLIDKKMEPIEAFKASWHATKGNSGKVWGIIGANFAMGLLIFTIIGIPFAIYFLIMYSAAIALLYSYLLQHPAEKAAPAAK